ncbi:MAG: membrane protein insertase YidC [Burkholderiales bacterium]|nr:membrane protein insertase YidC [Burkholderiales bacterium]
MDSRRLVIFIVLSLGLLLVWEKYFNPQPVQNNQITATASQTQANINNSAVSSNQPVVDSSSSTTDASAQIITVTTDVVQAKISTIGGNLISLDLLNHSSQENAKQPYKLLMDNNRVFMVQTGLVSNSGIKLPNHHSIFTADKLNYVLSPDKKSIQVNLVNNDNGIKIIKSYVFMRNSYVIDINYQIQNLTKQPLNGVSAYWSIVRDEDSPYGETKFAHTFTGPAYYTEDSKFETLKFSNVNSGDITYPEYTNNGWAGFIQHYFAVLWLLNANNHSPVCSNGVTCRLSFKPTGNNLVSAGFLTDLQSVAANSTATISMPLFAGPEDYKVLAASAPHLELTKDYGWVYIFATPLFWLLVKIFEVVKNWGVAIILLTIVVKMVLYPLTRASYISMAKMKALAPKMEQVKKQFGDDRAKFQQAMMQLYKSEKVNPIGGCLPMLLQIPVFIGLYWALLSSVELRQAPFLWIKDLSQPDPYYILPVILAGTMFLQTFLNPPPSDPVQAKMMKIMPIAFSIMFFLFPAGLVVYWLINNILSMSQQWYVNNHVSLRKQNRLKK